MSNSTQREFARIGPVTAADVATACDELLAAGGRPTVEKVREILGRGSMTTINKFLNTWWADLSERVAAFEKRPAVPDPLADLIANAWSAALELARTHAQNELAERSAVVEARHAEATSTFGAAEALRDAAETKLREMRETLERLQSRLDDESAEVGRLRTELASVKTGLLGAEAALADARRINGEQREDAMRERERAAAQLSEVSAARDADQVRWASQVDEARQALERATAAANEVESSLRTRLHAAETQRIEDARAIEAANAKIRALTEAAEVAARHAEERNRNAEERLAEMRQQHALEIARLEAAVATASALATAAPSTIKSKSDRKKAATRRRSTR